MVRNKNKRIKLMDNSQSIVDKHNQKRLELKYIIESIGAVRKKLIVKQDVDTHEELLCLYTSIGNQTEILIEALELVTIDADTINELFMIDNDESEAA